MLYRSISHGLTATRLSLQASRYVRAYSTLRCPDLRILFCGSDDFSAASLKALNNAKVQDELPIQSLEVLCRPPKRTGRGLKKLTEVPIVNVSKGLGLDLHQIDTLRGWELPKSSDINLIIAVSFGLLIPARIIQGAQYGGLNIHPSLLPDFRGAAPIEHALLEQCTETGVSLQTLHPTKFDHGALIAQERTKIDPHNEEVSAIRARLAEQGARLLIEGLRSGAFLDPEHPLEPPQIYVDGSPVQQRKAPKIVPEDAHLMWRDWTADQILLRQKVLGPLWSNLTCDASIDGVSTDRVKWTGGFKKTARKASDHDWEWLTDNKIGSVRFPLRDGTAVEIEKMTIAGKSEKTAKDARRIFKGIHDCDLGFD